MEGRLRRLPLTATAGKGAHPEKSGTSCADGTTTCSGHPWGSWGYEKVYSHTYLKQLPGNGGSGLPDAICANFYDVHDGGAAGTADFQKVKNADEITVDKANDNSIVKNAFNVNNGANCITVKLGTIQLKKEFLNAPSNNRANLFIKQGGNVIAGGQGQKLDAANGEGTAVLSVLPGSFDLSETAGANTNFAKYTSTWDCTKNGAPFVASTPGTSGAVQPPAPGGRSPAIASSR